MRYDKCNEGGSIAAGEAMWYGAFGPNYNGNYEITRQIKCHMRCGYKFNCDIYNNHSHGIIAQTNRYKHAHTDASSHTH